MTEQKTLIEALKAGDVPQYLIDIARAEGVEPETLAARVLAGRVVVPKNVQVELERPCAIGEGLSVKINANIGTSERYPDVEEELKKLAVAVEAGADAVMDLSTGGNLERIRTRIRDACPVPLGTVPIYEAALVARERDGSIVDMTVEDFFDVLERQVRQGVDFMTIHAGLNREGLRALEEAPRTLGVVSRGGSFMLAWMLHHDAENPYYEHFDRVLEILRQYDVTLSLGDSLRPGCIADATDRAQLTELATLGMLVRRAREAGVQVMVEGPGHVPLNEVEANIRLEKALCDGAPFYVLGPLPTDAAPGYDHIVSAIGGALAAYVGADFLCYVTPREHLGLPDIEDVREGVVAAKIAAHIADVARGLPSAREQDLRVARARARLDWQGQIENAIDPKRARTALAERSDLEGPCTMCGEFCAIDIVAKHFNMERVEEC
jgi:phosphomethylpyrimidine synthase